MSEAWKQLEGQVVDGEFHLRQYLGGSQHSAVFLTEHGEGEPPKAAIKLIPADPENAELQLYRWRLAAKLSHPHLLRLFKMGRCQLRSMGMLYVVMEYAEENLSQILPQRALTPAEVRDMLKPALDALAYIHSKVIVHGHVKPANIMAVGDQLKLSSDGLCRMGESSGGPGKPGAYDPPEAASGSLSPGADVWSLGMTLVEALTQRLPVWERTERAEPQLPDTLPAPFLEIAHHCLRRNPQRRWTVAEIAARLQPALPVPPSPAPRQQAAASPRESLAKRRYFVPAMAVGLTLAAILVVPRLLHRQPAAQQAPSAASKHARVQSKPKQTPVTAEAALPSQKTSDEHQTAGGPAASPASLRSDAAVKPHPAGFVPGEVLQQVLPDVPQSAKDTIRGTVRVIVKVRVDPSGNVKSAELDSPGPSKYFARIAQEAAQRWEFAPPKVGSHNVSSEWFLRFDFTQTGTKASPVQAAP